MIFLLLGNVRRLTSTWLANDVSPHWPSSQTYRALQSQRIHAPVLKGMRRYLSIERLGGDKIRQRLQPHSQVIDRT